MLVVKKDGTFEEFVVDKMIASIPHVAKEKFEGALITYRASLISALVIREGLEQQQCKIFTSNRLRELIFKELEDRGF